MALRLNSASLQRLQIAFDRLEHNQYFAIGGWIYPVSHAAGKAFIYMTQDPHLTSFYQDSLYLENGLLCVNSTNNNTGSIGVGTSLPTGAWSHVLLMRTQSNLLKGYLNGSLNASSPTEIGGRGVTAQMNVSADGSGGGYLNARLWGWKAWQDVVLSDNEVRTEMRRSEPVRRKNLYAWWPFLPGASRRFDFSFTAARHWTEYNAPTDEAPPPIAFRRPAPQIHLATPAAAGGYFGELSQIEQGHRDLAAAGLGGLIQE